MFSATNRWWIIALYWTN